MACASHARNPGNDSIAHHRLPETGHGDPDGVESLQPGYRLACGGFHVDVASVALSTGAGQETTGMWFLSAVGTQQSCRTIAAKMLKATPENAVLHPNQAATKEQWPWRFNVARHPGCPPGWASQVKRLPETRAWHLVILPRIAEYNRDEPQFLMLSPTEDLPGTKTLAALHYRYVDRRTREPIHPSWAEWLWDRALRQEEAVRLDGTGHPAWLCAPDMPLLAKDISEAIAQGLLKAQ